MTTRRRKAKTTDIALVLSVRTNEVTVSIKYGDNSTSQLYSTSTVADAAAYIENYFQKHRYTQFDSTTDEHDDIVFYGEKMVLTKKFRVGNWVRTDNGKTLVVVAHATEFDDYPMYELGTLGAKPGDIGNVVIKEDSLTRVPPEKKQKEVKVEVKLSEKPVVEVNPIHANLKVGDLVEVENKKFPLMLGKCRYKNAVVISVNPLILTSMDSCSRWQNTITTTKFVTIGTVNASVLKQCMRRLQPTEVKFIMNTENDYYTAME